MIPRMFVVRIAPLGVTNRYPIKAEEVVAPR